MVSKKESNITGVKRKISKMEYYFKVLLYVLCMHEKKKGGSDMYSLLSSLSILSFLILLNLHTALLAAEYLFPDVFSSLNNWIYHESNLVMTVVTCFFIPFLWFQLRRSRYKDFLSFEKEMENSPLVQRFGFVNAVFYSVISAIVFLIILFVNI